MVTIAEAVDESLRKTTARNASPFVAERERRCLTAKERLVNASYGPNDRTCARRLTDDSPMACAGMGLGREPDGP